MEGTGRNETESKENATTIATGTEPPKFGRRQHRHLSSTDNATAIQSSEATEATKEAPQQEKWVDDIVADVDAIPEMADAKDDRIVNLLSSTPMFKVTDSIQSLKELDGEIGLQLSTNDEGIDLSLLTRMMFPPELLLEPDVAWRMDLLMSEIASEAQIKKDNRTNKTF